MNKIFTLLFLGVAVNSIAQVFTSTAPIPVATGMGNYHPQMELTTDGVPAVIWVDNNTKNLYFAKHNGNDAFNTPVQLNPTGMQVQSYNWSGPDLKVEGNNIYVAFKEYGLNTGHIYFVKSTDNGLTFSDTVRVDDFAAGYPQFPDIDVHEDTVWVVMLHTENSGLNPHYRVSRSVDGGANWEADVAASDLWPGESCDCCPPEIIADANRVIVFSRNNDNNTREFKAVVSYDRGASFTDTYSVDDHGWVISSCPSTGADACFVGSDHTLTVYRTEESGAQKLFLTDYNLQTDAADTIVDIYATSATNMVINYPQLDYKNGVLAVVWESLGNGIDVFMNVSSTGASGLIPANGFNLTDISGTQNKPEVAVGDGVFHVVYMDTDGNNVKYVQVNYLAGLDETNNKLLGNVYPVPALDHVIFQFNNPQAELIQVTVSDLQGKVVAELSTSGNEVMLEKGQLASGTYNYVVRSAASSVHGKLIF